MTRARWVLLVVVLVAAGGGAWWWLQGRPGSPLRAKSTHLAVRWKGRYYGGMALPAQINWCPGTRRGILEAVSGDSGVAVVLYDRDSLTPGVHSIVSPDAAGAITPPGATVVMRWMRTDRDTAVTGFRSQGGTVRVQYSGGRASGEINARMRSQTGTDTLVVDAVFRDIPVATTAAACS